MGAIVAIVAMVDIFSTFALFVRISVLPNRSVNDRMVLLTERSCLQNGPVERTVPLSNETAVS